MSLFDKVKDGAQAYREQAEKDLRSLRNKFNSFTQAEPNELEDKLLSLEERVRKLEDKLLAYSVSEIVLKGPNGSNTITLAATDYIGGLWIESVDTSQIVLYNKPSPTVGVYGPKTEAEGTDAEGKPISVDTTVINTLSLPGFPV